MHFPMFNEKRYDALMEFFELPTRKKISELPAGSFSQIQCMPR